MEAEEILKVEGIYLMMEIKDLMKKINSKVLNVKRDIAKHPYMLTDCKKVIGEFCAEPKTLDRRYQKKYDEFKADKIGYHAWFNYLVPHFNNLTRINRTLDGMLSD